MFGFVSIVCFSCLQLALAVVSYKFIFVAVMFLLGSARLTQSSEWLPEKAMEVVSLE